MIRICVSAQCRTEVSYHVFSTIKTKQPVLNWDTCTSDSLTDLKGTDIYLETILFPRIAKWPLKPLKLRYLHWIILMLIWMTIRQISYHLLCFYNLGDQCCGRPAEINITSLLCCSWFVIKMWKKSGKKMIGTWNWSVTLRTMNPTMKSGVGS